MNKDSHDQRPGPVGRTLGGGHGGIQTARKGQRFCMGRSLQILVRWIVGFGKFRLLDMGGDRATRDTPEIFAMTSAFLMACIAPKRKRSATMETHDVIGDDVRMTTHEQFRPFVEV